MWVTSVRSRREDRSPSRRYLSQISVGKLRLLEPVIADGAPNLTRAYLSASGSLFRGLCQPLITRSDLQHDPPRVGRGKLVGLKPRFLRALKPILLVMRLGWHAFPVPRHRDNVRRGHVFRAAGFFVPNFSLEMNDLR